MKFISTILISLFCYTSQAQVTKDFFGEHFLGPFQPTFKWPTSNPTFIRPYLMYWCNPRVCTGGNIGGTVGTRILWRDLEYAANTFDFAGVGRMLDSMQNHGAEMVYTFGRTPQFYSTQPGLSNYYAYPPSDTANFGRFIRALANYAKNRGTPIKYWEIWNEPEANSSEWADTSWNNLAKMGRCVYMNIKAIDPTYQVLTPSTQGSGADYWMGKYFAAGGAPYCDIVAYHAYLNFYNGGTQEKFEVLADKMRALMVKYGISGKQLWDDEAFDAFSAGVNVQSPYTTAKADTQSAYMAQRYLISAAKGLDKCFWYAWDANNGIELTDTDGNGSYEENGIGAAHRKIREWMIGATVTNLVIANNIYSVDLTSGGTTRRAVWVNNSTALYATSYGQYETLGGTTSSVVGGTVTVGRKPILLKSGDLTAPTPGGGLAAGSTTSSGTTLTWTKGTDNVTAAAAIKYTAVQSQGSTLATLVNAIDAGIVVGTCTDCSTMAVSGLQSSTAYHANVIIEDAAGNKAIYSPVAFTTTGDVTTPTVGTGPTTSGVGTTSLTLNWGAATDNVTASSLLTYRGYRSSSSNMTTVANAEANGTLVGSGTGIGSAVITGLAPATTYYFTVVVQDAAGNKSVYATISVTTASVDATAPSPGNSGTISACCAGTGSFTASWSPAADNVTAQTQLIYTVYFSLYNNISTATDAQTFGNIAGTGANLTSKTISGLASGATYYVTVVVSDSTGNKAIYQTRSYATTQVSTYRGRKKK